MRDRNVLELIAAGGNVYYLAKFAGIFGLNVQDIGAQQTGMCSTISRRISRAGEVDHGSRSSAALATTHVPSIGNAIAKGLQHDPYWKPFFDGFPPVASTGSTRSSPMSWS